ncbi:DUF1661 domain-containing protein [Porphyromonas gingivalis]|nr:DUF1661 domain-containing protein [Porphyromonas gingivalis]MCE8179720.1 DUF1661 domain-containing protein [Porphyromonas gingivalis]
MVGVSLNVQENYHLWDQKTWCGNFLLLVREKIISRTKTKKNSRVNFQKHEP